MSQSHLYENVFKENISNLEFSGELNDFKKFINIVNKKLTILHTVTQAFWKKKPKSLNITHSLKLFVVKLKCSPHLYIIIG